MSLSSRSHIYAIPIADVPMHWTHSASTGIGYSFRTVLSPSSLQASPVPCSLPFASLHGCSQVHMISIIFCQTWSLLTLCHRNITRHCVSISSECCYMSLCLHLFRILLMVLASNLPFNGRFSQAFFSPSICQVQSSWPLSQTTTLLLPWFKFSSNLH